MEMKQINKVSIALKPNVYSTFRNLNNTVSNTLGEYVDNAVQSFLNHKTELFDLESNYKLRIEISVDWENRTILGEFYQFNLSSCIRQQNSLTAQFVSFSLANLANIFYPPRFLQ